MQVCLILRTCISLRFNEAGGIKKKKTKGNHLNFLYLNILKYKMEMMNIVPIS